EISIKNHRICAQIKKGQSEMPVHCVLNDNDISKHFKDAGLSDQKVVETMRNSNLSKRLVDILLEAKSLLHPAALEKSKGVLLYSLAIKYICCGKIVNERQLTAAVEYLNSKDVIEGKFDTSSFESSCGINQVTTIEDITKVVSACIERKREQIDIRGYSCFAEIIADVKQILKWADGKTIKDVVEKELESIIGSRTQFNKKTNPTQHAIKETTKPEAIDSHLHRNPDNSLRVDFDFSNLSNFHRPGENYKTEGYIVTPNTMKLLKEHLERTRGKVITRFPPEPNGILHIGHAKSINLNFGYAKEHNGITYLRFDDTNPEKEELRFFEGIINIVEWLGYKPFKIKYASDYFDRMFDLAQILIKRNLAYVCHQVADELKRDSSVRSPWRDRSILESLKLFQDMRDGLFDEGAATLRMKIIMEDGKEDPVAYRIKFAPHARTGNKWCIYPTYDYTHCLNDSFEDITHSMCTKEFQNRRSSYYWLNNALDLYCPVQWEFGRLNLYYTVVSKRKIAKLIEHQIVRNWDDPRLFTLEGLRRRGIPPEAINFFCSKIGITTAQTTLHPDLLDACTREVLNLTAQRVMAIPKPVHVEIVNFPAGQSSVSLNVPDFPQEPDRGDHIVKFTSNIYIDTSDFKEVHDTNYKRFSPKQPVGLRHTGYLIFWKSTLKVHLLHICVIVNILFITIVTL
ncbi:hypothetical protein GJ496_010035, partial [Pomphorhynchus laevis]